MPDDPVNLSGQQIYHFHLGSKLVLCLSSHSGLLYPVIPQERGSLVSLLSIQILTVLCSFSHQPQTPHLEEDLKEVLRSEAGIELIIEDDVKPEKQKRKQGVR